MTLVPTKSPLTGSYGRPRRRQPAGTALQHDPLDLIERNLIISPIVELSRPRAFIARPFAGRVRAGRRCGLGGRPRQLGWVLASR
jgi:hypothetical protein